MPGSEEFWGMIGTPLTGLIVIVLLWAKSRIERDLKRTTEVVENGIQGRFDKIEAGVFGARTELDNLSRRVSEIETKVSGGTGQHFVPPTTAVNVGEAEAIEGKAESMSPPVPGTRQE